MAEDQSARDIVAKNVKRLMSQNPALETQAKLGKKAGVEQRTIGYLINVVGDGPKSPKLDTVEKVARAFGLEPWMLLIDSDSFGEELTKYLQRPAATDVRLAQSGIAAPDIAPAPARAKARARRRVTS